jgi:hypothetical protein
MAASSSITLLQTMEWAKKFNFNRSSAIGDFGEPALTSANTIAQTMLGAPFSWRWNRAIIGFITIANQQDYTVFNYQPSTNTKIGWFTIDDAGNCQMCTIPGATGTAAPTWNHTKGGFTTDGAVTWENQGFVLAEAQGPYTFAWIENSSVQDTIQGAPKWKEMTSKIVLGLESNASRPDFISAQIDDGLGNITFRLLATPDQAYPVAITIQQKPPLFKTVNQTWGPIPDEYSHIYNWGFLSMMWLFSDDPRFQMANAKFIAGLLSTHGGLTQTQLNIFLQNWQMVSGAQTQLAITQQQENTGRGQ